MSKIPETVYAEVVRRWLIGERYDVYPEVSLGPAGSLRPDFIAVRPGVKGRVVSAINVKTTFSWAVVEQAHRIKPYVHYSYVAVPRCKGDFDRAEFLQEAGIGTILIMDGARGDWDNELGRLDVMRAYAPAMNKSAQDVWRLCDEHKQFGDAGSKSGYYSPFRQTCSMLRKIVSTSPGCSLSDAISTIHHHYASDQTAKASISRWIDKGVIEGVEKRYGERGRVFLYPVETAEVGG